uniref:Cytochrome P450 n=1 Tax=Haemonchus placei TaxID=6290 RepID=A0A0N4VVE3_HAEPC
LHRERTEALEANYCYRILETTFIPFFFKCNPMLATGQDNLGDLFRFTGVIVDDIFKIRSRCHFGQG